MLFVEVVPRYIEHRKKLFDVRENLTKAKSGGRINLDDMLFAESEETKSIASEYKLVIEQYADKLRNGYIPTPEEIGCQVELCRWLDRERDRR